MKKTSELTLSAILTALGVIFLLFGRLVPSLDIVAILFASMPIVFGMLELRRVWPYLIYLATSALALMLFFSLVTLEYILFGGIYPIVKYYFEKLPRRLALLPKLLFFNLVAIGATVLAKQLFGIELAASRGLLIPLLLLANLTFLIYDLLMTQLIARYFTRIRPKIKRFLK
jgi:hypothetical protein